MTRQELNAIILARMQQLASKHKVFLDYAYSEDGFIMIDFDADPEQRPALAQDIADEEAEIERMVIEDGFQETGYEDYCHVYGIS